ncbi:MAG: leucine-rich repeat domain-containing protein [Saprospiraceae bacterium]
MIPEVITLCINLEALYLSSNQILDYSFLEKLTNLQTLYLIGNQISDIDRKRLEEKLPNCEIYF